MNDEIRKVVLDGNSYYERGCIHGETLRSLVHEHRQRWEQELLESTGLDVRTYLDKLLSETHFLPAIKRWTPELLEEVEGIAAGAAIDSDYVLVRQLSDEEPWYRREAELAAANSEAGSRGCSSIGLDATASRPTVIGQNMDCPTWYDGHQFLFHHKGPDLQAEVMNFSLAGKINLCGLNSNGVAMCCNTLSQLDYCIDGLPEDFVVRGFLARNSLQQGRAFLREIKHASGQNYTVAEPGSRAINLEVSANKIVEFSIAESANGAERANRVFHTNHALANDDQQLFQMRKAAGAPVPGSTSTRPRYDELQRRLGNLDQELGIDDLKAAFSSHEGPVCRHPNDGSRAITLGCLIMELDEEISLHVAPGPPCSTPFKVYGF